MNYIFYFLIAFIFCVFFVPIVKKLAKKLGAIDLPGKSPRKIHTKPVPLLGGLAVYTTFCICILVYALFGNVNFTLVPPKFFYALVVSGAVLILGGILDDKYDLPPKLAFLFPVVASLVIALSGIGVGIKFITNPFGGIIPLHYAWLGIPLSGVFVLLWLLGMTYTTKILDGMDGLVSGVGVIGAFTLFGLSLTERVSQPVTATLAVVLAGALIGFLVYNFHPASVFLGEGGSTLVGFLLGVLAIISGAKIATTLLVMGIPILDVAWAIVRRLYTRNSPFVGDRRHLHFRLLDIGLGQRSAVLILWGISAIFGFTAVFLQSMGKLVALGIVLCVMVALVTVTVLTYKKQQ